jgi:hypothetical protein
MLHNKLHTNYFKTTTLNELADYVFENNLLIPFIQHLSELMKLPDVIQTIYDYRAPIDDNGQTTKKLSLDNEETSGRLFFNMIVTVTKDKSSFNIREIPFADSLNEKNYKKTSDYHDVILPEMSFLNEHFKNLFLDIFEKIIVALQGENKQKKSSNKKKKSDEKTNILSQDNKLRGREDEVLKSVLCDVLLRACTSLKMEKNNPWAQFIANLETIKFIGDIEKLELFILEAIQFVLYSHIKNAYQEKILAESLSQTLSCTESKASSKLRSSSSNHSFADSGSKKMSLLSLSPSSLFTSSTSSLGSPGKSGDSRTRSVSSSSYSPGRSMTGNVFSGSDSGPTTPSTTSTTTTNVNNSSKK